MGNLILSNGGASNHGMGRNSFQHFTADKDRKDFFGGALKSFLEQTALCAIMSKRHLHVLQLVLFVLCHHVSDDRFEPTHTNTTHFGHFPHPVTLFSRSVYSHL